MPFINSKVTVKIGENEKKNIREGLTKAAANILGKPEQYLMLGFEEECDLYFQGNNDAPTAFVEVKIYGRASSTAYDKFTQAVCDLLEKQLGIPGNRIYVKYEEVSQWGFNGSNF